MKMPEANYKFRTKKFMTIVQKTPHKIRKRMKQSPVLIDVSALFAEDNAIQSGRYKNTKNVTCCQYCRLGRRKVRNEESGNLQGYDAGKRRIRPVKCPYWRNIQRHFLIFVRKSLDSPARMRYY